MTATAPDGPLDVAAVGEVPPVESAPNPSTPEAALLARLAALPVERRSGTAITDADLSMVIALPLSHYGDLRAELRALRVDLKTFDARVAEGRVAAKKRPALRVVRPGDEEDPRPVIRCGPDLPANIAAAVEALATDPDLYISNRALVRIVRGAPDEPPVIVPHTLATLRARLAEFARCQKCEMRKAGPEWSDCLPPDPVTRAILEGPEWWAPLRQLTGVIENPALRPDGTLIDEPGYDVATGFLYLPTIDFPPVRANPEHRHSAEALRYMWTNLCYDFPFRGLGYPAADHLTTDPEGLERFKAARDCPDAWGIPVAAMTLFARPAIAGSIPAIVFDASGPAAGKGLQVDVACIVATGRIPGKLTWPNRGKDTDYALETMLGGEALGGATVTVLDEITGAFGGPALNKVLTGDGWTKIRVLGASATPLLRWVSVVLGTGNNITFCDNTHRRMLMPRLEPTIENPEAYEGDRRHRDLRAWTRANRGKLAAACLTVLRGYVHAGCPDVGMPPMASFEQWSELVPRAIRWAGGGDVLACRPTADPEARNEERDGIAVILDAISKLEPRTEDRPTGEGITAKKLIDFLYPHREHGEPYDDGYDDARDAIEALTHTATGKPKSKPLGDRLKTWKRRPIGARMIEAAPAKDRNGAVRWRVVPVKR